MVKNLPLILITIAILFIVAYMIHKKKEGFGNFNKLAYPVSSLSTMYMPKNDDKYKVLKGTSDFVIGDRMNLAGIYKNDSSNLNLEVYYGDPMKIFMMFTLKSGVDRNVDDTMGKEITYKTKTKIPALCGDGKNETTEMIWHGKGCGDRKIKWNSMTSLKGTLRPGLTQEQCSWKRMGNNAKKHYGWGPKAWNKAWVGDCGVSPTEIELPTKFEDNNRRNIGNNVNYYKLLSGFTIFNEEKGRILVKDIKLVNFNEVPDDVQINGNWNDTYFTRDDISLMFVTGNLVFRKDFVETRRRRSIMRQEIMKKVNKIDDCPDDLREGFGNLKGSVRWNNNIVPKMSAERTICPPNMVRCKYKYSALKGPNQDLYCAPSKDRSGICQGEINCTINSGVVQNIMGKDLKKRVLPQCPPPSYKLKLDNLSLFESIT